MSARNPVGTPQPLDPNTLELLSRTLTPIRKDEVIVYRGAERLSIISFRAPARGRLSRHAIRLLGDCAEHYKQGSRYPGALRASQGELAGFAVFEPVAEYDAAAPDQYQIKWTKGYKQASIDLLQVLQPRNLQVSRGHVAEMPFTLESLPNNVGLRLVLHLLEAHVRVIKEIPKEEEANFTNDDADEQEKEEPGAAPGTQE